MASYVDLIVKTSKGIKFYDVNDPFMDQLLHPDFFKMESAEKYLNAKIKEWEWPLVKKLSNHTFENRICLIDFTTKTFYNARIFPINEYCTLGIFLRLKEDRNFANNIEALFHQGYLNRYKTISKNQKVIKEIHFKNFKQYTKNLKKIISVEYRYIR